MKPRMATISVAILACAVSAHAADELKDCDACPVLVVVPAGEFAMGSDMQESSHPDEKPAHLVRIAKAFAVGKFEVTFDQWDACSADGGCTKVDDEGWGRTQHPVINVDFTAAQSYLLWLSKKTGKRYRLLSESEWEYAARAGTATAWHWGTIAEGIGLPEACLFANTHDESSKKTHAGYNWLAHPCDDGFAETAPVGKFKPNAFGLYDMLGNVREWVADCHGAYKDAPTDGAAVESNDCETRVARGGAWLDGPTWTRSAYRFPLSPKYANYAVGLRVARDLP